MTDTIKLINIAVEVGGIILCAMAIMMVLLSPKIRPRMTRYFLHCFVTLSALSACNILGLMLRGQPGTVCRRWLFISNFFEFWLSLGLIYCVVRFFILFIDPKGRLTAERWTLAGLFFAGTAMLVYSQFTGLYYIIDGNNYYVRQPGYAFAYVVPALIICEGVYLLIRYRERVSPRTRAVFSICFALPFSAGVFHMQRYGVNITIFATILGGFAMYIYIVTDQSNRYYRQVKQNARQKNNIMVLQMRPHFICNTLTSIYCLNKTDHEKAQQAILDFTDYLRIYFDTLSHDDMIPFREELDHTRAYLEVEQVRLEGCLVIRFDTPFTGFRVPPLTVQPIVENAVKYGMDSDQETLDVIVRTRKTKRGSEIIVEDNGPGFSPTAHEKNRFKALDNIRERLEMMCGGSLDIAPRKGGGTVIRIRIPNAHEHQHLNSPGPEKEHAFAAGLSRHSAGAH